MQNLSYFVRANSDYIEYLLETYRLTPEAIDSSWRYFFDGLTLESSPEVPQNSSQATAQNPAQMAENTQWELRVAGMLTAFRHYGHCIADLDPLTKSATKLTNSMLELSHFKLGEKDLSRITQAGKLIGAGELPLSGLIERLKEIYCGKAAVELKQMSVAGEIQWLEQNWEKNIGPSQKPLSPELKKAILKRLLGAQSFERFLHTRYVAQKRFSIEGAEALLPALDCLIETGSEQGAQVLVIGMAHRGRLSVLTQLFEKPYEQIFTEFEGAYAVDSSRGEGDVKYHMGLSSTVKSRLGKSVRLNMPSNPSHLEFVGPVVQGISRAKQDHKKWLGVQDAQNKIIPVLIHGDAAFTGQGVVFETLMLSQLRGYATGGTIHIITNNQVGFTTDPAESRSTPYCSDPAKVLEIPIFHVNADDPEAVWRVMELASLFRMKFKKDVLIDLVCYRKHGHNEGDEPAFTQPLLYKKIKSHPSPAEIYSERLLKEAVVSKEDLEFWVEAYSSALREAQTITKAQAPAPLVSSLEGPAWTELKRPKHLDLMQDFETRVAEERIRSLAEKLNQFPSHFQVHPKLKRLFESRKAAISSGLGIDWGNAETLAYASLLEDSYSVRLSGQDSQRGTFTHRHCVLKDFETAQAYCPLEGIKTKEASKSNAHFEAYNSHLSETGTLGFEYGYSITHPKTLVVWEAQFGDFANGAQVIIDQFIATGESKWQRMSGLTLLLPHGYEGQAAEHSSARLERFLQLCGKLNMVICNLSTPAQIFHALRRQMIWPYRKPLVIMSPKSLLRHPMAVSKLSDLSQKNFVEFLDDPLYQANTQEGSQEPSKAKRLLLCSGKIYYDLVLERAHQKKEGTIAILRLEQLYPWPAEKILKTLKQYSNSATIHWVQEEPRNMGAWSYIFNLWSGGYENFAEKVENRPIHYIGRDFAASPAVGSHHLHEVQQEDLIQKAIN